MTRPAAVAAGSFLFVAFAAPTPAPLRSLFSALGFTLSARQPKGPWERWRQGGIDFLLDATLCPASARFVEQHGPGACAFAVTVEDSDEAVEVAQASGAAALPADPGLPLPGVAGIDGAALHLLDPGDRNRYEAMFTAVDAVGAGAGLTTIDHLTHNVRRGRMDWWADFYRDALGLTEIRHFTIAGQRTGLRSRAMGNDTGIRIPINESADDSSQIAEFLHQFNGEGIQHIALATADILTSVDRLKAAGIGFLDTPATYYEDLPDRLPQSGLDVAALHDRRILADGGPGHGGGLLLQIFTDPLVGPLFFEIIERRGNQGFGEGNFQALFEAIERDQVRRGVLPA